MTGNKKFRFSAWKNEAPLLCGSIGIHYDNYRDVGGPIEIEFLFYFFGVCIEFGPGF